MHNKQCRVFTRLRTFLISWTKNIWKEFVSTRVAPGSVKSLPGFLRSNLDCQSWLRCLSNPFRLSHLSLFQFLGVAWNAAEPLADCCVQRGLKREGVSLWFLAAHRAAEAKLGLVSLTSYPPSPSSPALLKRFSGPLMIPRSSSRNYPSGWDGTVSWRVQKGFAVALGHNMGTKKSPNRPVWKVR